MKFSNNHSVISLWISPGLFLEYDDNNAMISYHIQRYEGKDLIICKGFVSNTINFPIDKTSHLWKIKTMLICWNLNMFKKVNATHLQLF